MHTAYNLGSLLKLPHAIQSMAAFGDFLLVGTKQGHLLMYLVKFNEPLPGEVSCSSSNSEIHFDATVQLLKSNTDYKKPIVQMEVKEIGPKQFILVVLCDGVVSVHYISQKESNVPNISAATRMPHPKGAASAFSLDVVRQKTLTGELSAVIRIAVAVRKKLQFFYWKKEKFHELHPEVSTPYEPRSIAWCKDSICVAFVGGYSLIKLNRSTSSDGICELFSAGIKNEKQNSSVTLLSDERFALVEDRTTKLVDLEGNASKSIGPLTWTEPPVALAHDSPYLIGLLKKTVEIRTDQPSLHIQTLELVDPKLVCCHKPGLTFVASSSQVWFLKMVPTSKQVTQLLFDKHFELAIRLCNLSSGENVQQKSDRIREIQTLFAFDQFCHGKFKDAMDTFHKLDIDPSHVIGLYSDLLPSEFISQLKYPSKIPPLEMLGFENAISALIEFLIQVRHKLNGLSSKKVLTLPIMEGPVIESKSKLMEIIDTTLLKCYLLNKSGSLIASLLRLKENQCHLEETERTLKKNRKFSELIILYNTRGLHRKALTLMKDHFDKEDSPLRGHSKMVEYLQNLSADNIDIVCEFATDIFQRNPHDGLQIFIDDLMEVEAWPRAKVLEFLVKYHKSSVILYLEHVISIWNETGALFHNALLLQYKDVVVDLNDKQLNNEESEILECTKQKLKELLTTSSHYTAEAVLKQFPTNCLFEERALLLGSLGRHMEALAIYLYLVRNVEEAFAYAARHDSPSNIVWTALFRLLIQPPDGPMLQAMDLPKNPSKPDLPNALRLLKERGAQVDLMTVLLNTPASIQLEQLAPYLEAAMERRVSERHHTQLLRGLMHSQFLQVQEERIRVESQQVILTEMDSCPVCLKKFRNQGTLVRFPNGRVVHFSCQERAMMVS